MPIITYPAAILRQIAKPVTNFNSPQLSELIHRLFGIMQEKNGAGLAAPQIGVSQRVIVYGFDKNPRYPEQAPIAKDYAINPEILWLSKNRVVYKEGCLSFPGQRVDVSRPESIIFSSYDMMGYKRVQEASGFKARVILHEKDHLDGVTLQNWIDEDNAKRLSFGLR